MHDHEYRRSHNVDHDMRGRDHNDRRAPSENVLGAARGDAVRGAGGVGYNSGQRGPNSSGGGVILEGQLTIRAPRDRVWAAIWDIPKLASWVPGCTSAVQVDDETYRANLEQQIGFLKASFALLLKVVETDPPQRIRLHGEGEDRRLRSSIQVEIEVMLEPVGDAT